MFYKTLFIVLSVCIVTALPSANSGTAPQPAPVGAWALAEFNYSPEDATPADHSLFEPAQTKSYPISMFLNPSVENELEYFQTEGRATFQSWLYQSARYAPLMKDIFKESGMPEDLVYLSMIESGFNPHAVSWANAVGPWQFMTATAKEYGLRIDPWIDERMDPVKSTYAAAVHLKVLYSLFGSWPLALASYNAGAGKVQRAVLRTDFEDAWDLFDSRFVRQETRSYVPRFIAAVIIARNPEAYGFTQYLVAPFLYDEVIIRKSTKLSLIARCAGSTLREIKELNPQLLQEVTPPNRTSYVVRIPKGSKEVFLANFYVPLRAPYSARWDMHLIESEDIMTGRHFTTKLLHRHEKLGPPALSQSTDAWIKGLAYGRDAEGDGILLDLRASATRPVSHLTAAGSGFSSL